MPRCGGPAWLFSPSFVSWLGCGPCAPRPGRVDKGSYRQLGGSAEDGGEEAVGGRIVSDGTALARFNDVTDLPPRRFLVHYESP